MSDLERLYELETDARILSADLTALCKSMVAAKRPISPLAEPPWMLTARGEIGVKETPGPKHTERVEEYLATCAKAVGGNLGSWALGQGDELAWCSAFVNWCLLRSMVEPTRSAGAKSFMGWGVPCDAREGAIVVLSRSGGGHVGFLVSVGDGKIQVLGGNQGNQVCIQSYPTSRIKGYRWPS